MQLVVSSLPDFHKYHAINKPLPPPHPLQAHTHKHVSLIWKWACPVFPLGFINSLWPASDLARFVKRTHIHAHAHLLAGGVGCSVLLKFPHQMELGLERVNAGADQVGSHVLTGLSEGGYRG